MDPRVVAVYAFGSRARGEAGPRSDFDFAVLIEGSVSLAEEARLGADLAETIGREDLDLIILNQAPPLLRYEVVAAGCRLFARDEATADRFEEAAARECFDTAHLRDIQRRLAREARR